MTKKLITNSFKNYIIDQLIESVDEPANTVYYMMLGNHLETPNSEIITPNNSVQYLLDETYDNMLFGKNITKEDMSIMTNRYDWEANTIYTMYDHRDGDLNSKPFFVTVDSGSFKHVFKCLNNNNGIPSTQEPQFSDVSQEEDLFDQADGFYETSDGYQWKYMYSIDIATFGKFATEKYIPIIANTSVSSSAINGSIDVIKIEEPGARYDNYISGTFDGSDIGIASFASPITERNYALRSTASSTNGFYTGCTIQIVEGTGKGQYRTIVNYINDGVNKIAVLDLPFDNVDSTSEYQVSPTVLVEGNGVGSRARAIINSSGNTVSSVLVLDRGQEYRFATATIVANSVVPVASVAQLTPIISPYGGHGFDAEKELNGRYLGISIKFSNTEANTIQAENDFRSVSIIRDPKFANVQITHIKVSDGTPGADGLFLLNEDVYQVKSKKLCGFATINVESTLVTGTNTFFKDSLNIDDTIYFRDGNNYSFSTVASLANNEAMSISSNALFTSSNAEIYLTDIIASGRVISVGSGEIHLTDVEGFIIPEQKIIGKNSGAAANVTSIDINNINKNGGYQTINQMTHFEGTPISGNFQQDELIYQGPELNPTATAYFHSFWNEKIYVTNVKGSFIEDENIFGTQSGASFNISNINIGEIIVGSGDIIYTQNEVPVTRENNKNEIIKVIIGF